MALSIIDLEEVPPQKVIEYFGARGRSEGFVRWKYFDSNFNAGRRRGWVWFKNDRVYGFIGLIPFDLAHQERRFSCAWTCDWSLLDPGGAPGAGILLFKKAIEAAPHLATFYGNANTRKIVPRLATITVEDSAYHLWLPLRMAPLLDRLKRRVPGADRPLPIDRLGGLPSPRRSGWLPSARAASHDGIPSALAALVNRPQASAWYPHYDFEAIRWQLGRCPDIEAATVLAPAQGTPRAAAVIWHLRASKEWRLALFHEPGAEDLIPLVIAQAARAAWRRGGNSLSTLVSRMDRPYHDALVRQPFLETHEQYPLYLFKPPEDPMPFINLQRLSFLATDMASIG